MTTIDREILSAPIRPANAASASSFAQAGRKETTPAEIAVPPTLIPGEQKQAAITPQQRYRQGIEGIWEKVRQLPTGQDQVVMSQLWEFGKTSATLTPKRFPALAAHGFITEQLVEDQVVWKPYSPYLKNFWRIGINVSQAYGFRLRPHQAFEASLRAEIQMYMPVDKTLMS